MARWALLAVSVVCCVFGVLTLWGPHDFRDAARVVNVSLAVLLAIGTGRDLLKRGWGTIAVLAGASYVLAPLVGFVAYAIASARDYRGPGDSAVASSS